MKTAIAEILAWSAFDSRGTPTVGCRITLDDGAFGDCTAPSGASQGRHEAHELRDGGAKFGGKGVSTAVGRIRDVLAPAMVGLRFENQENFDATLRELDGTPNFSNVGGNAAVALSIAFLTACAKSSGQELHEFVAEGEPLQLPLPMVNIISGGAHAGRSIDIQDFMAVPVGARTFSEAMEWVWRVRAAAHNILAQRGHLVALVADEGGLSAPFETNSDALELLTDAISAAGLQPGLDVSIAIDVAASQLLNSTGSYQLAAEGRIFSSDEFIAELGQWCDSYPVVSVEDPLGEDDWSAWTKAKRRLANVQLVGDDLFVTNPDRVRRGIANDSANAVLVKLNQVGTVTDARLVLDLARGSGMSTIVSARSGDTEDFWLADLAMGWRSGQIKVGSTMRSERLAKWNRLLQCEATLGLEYAGAAVVGR